MRAAQAPSRLAVADDRGQLTYAELVRESNRLAARLQEAGAGQGKSVGIFLPRSTGFVVAALAVLKSGAAYVPLDHSTPADRISFILADAGVVAVISERAVAKDLPHGSWKVLETESIDTKPAAPFVDVKENRDSLAYIVYTSGSTGQPKGVEITRANLCSLLEWHQSAFAVTATDRASQLAGLGFDAAGWEIWPYLTAGASLYIADENTRRSPGMLRDWLVAKKITIGFVPTFLAEQLFDADWPDETALRILLTGGDRLGRRPRNGLPFTVINNYGPTECTVVATSGVVSPEGSSADRPSIGRPIANVTALILDEALRPVAPGEPGELCIAGESVGRGYRNMPERTASCFVTILTSGEPLRIYRTGDRARMLANGEIEFLGRFDDQVKIRGYRVELGEIVACLNRNPDVESSTVIVSDGRADGPALVAYVVPRDGASVTESGLRAYLAAKLPDYMIPISLISISALPVTANGKLDKSALPAPRGDDRLAISATEHSGTEQCSVAKERVAELVASLLNLPSIGADENFFMAGGHSMFGVQLVAKIRETFGVKLTLRQLFKAPTVATLSTEVARCMETSKASM